jgi:hypothetical protein
VFGGVSEVIIVVELLETGSRENSQHRVLRVCRASESVAAFFRIVQQKKHPLEPASQ